MIEYQEIDDIASAIMAQKESIALAQKRLRELEEEMIDAVGVKTEGSFTVKGDEWKVTTTGIINRTVDNVALFSWGVKGSIPQELFEQLFKFKPSVNMSLFRALEKTNPEVYLAASKALTAKPGKPRVTIEKREQ